MAKVLKSDKGFKLIETNRVEMAAIGSQGVCDSCNDLPEEGVYIAVLGMWFCKGCYNEWDRNAIRYEQDAVYENRNFETYKQLFKVKD